MTVDANALTSDESAIFGSYVLDQKRGCLFRDGIETPLRPKTFAVLCYLVGNAGRLVAKEELFSTIWPKLAVTDDALVQSISELRRVFGEDGHLIATIPRRGYRFDGEIRRSNVHPSPQPSSEVVSRDPARSDSITRGAPWFLAVVGVAAFLGSIATWYMLQSQPGRTALPPRQAVMTAKPAIAVLPFVNQGGDTRDIFADGLTQDLIAALGRFSALTVMSWNAVLPFKGVQATPDTVARALKVRYQLEGVVRQSNERVRVSAQLVNDEGKVLWSARFDEPLSDFFALQDKMTGQIAAFLAVRLKQIEQRRALGKPTHNLEAYDFVLRASPALQRPERAANAEARTLLRRAIELDPQYAAAHSALAETFYNAVAMGWAQSPAAFFERAQGLANKALSLSDNEVRAHVILGRIHIFHHRYDQAKLALDSAIEINPNDAQALAGRGNILMWMGETEAAIRSLELSQNIDPELHAFDRFALGLAYYLTGRYEAAAVQAQLILEQAEDAHFTRALLAATYAQLRRGDDAARMAMILSQKDPTFDAKGFGSKFLNQADLERLREGLRKAGLFTG